MLLPWEKMHFWPAWGQAEVDLNGLAFILEAEHLSRGGDWTHSIFRVQGFGNCVSPEVSQSTFPRCVLTGLTWPRSLQSQAQLSYGGSVTGFLTVIRFSLSDAG